ncbi:MAG: putative DNA binding domain-containing protein [Chloroflexi bacterium]|nr:putative DNA binding domain-containing protein [Chloroflexota bacterium]MCL5273830.1 putative DNA binding domain-containing protein [Chloroflexota bacterium]
MAYPRTSSQVLALLPELDSLQIAETLVAFANSDGGTIVLGYDERGKELNRAESEDVESALRNAVEQCRPPVRATLEPADGSSGGPSLVIRVPRSSDLHALDDGRVLVRAGAENRPLRGDEIRNLATSKATSDFEIEAVPGATLDDFDQAVVDEYIAKREERMRRKTTGDRHQLLHDIGAMDHRHQPTVAGILLFGRNPQAFLPQSGMVFVKFPGVDPRGDGGAMGYGRREEINGPLARIVERSWQVVLEEMRVGAIVTGLERQDVLEYPEYAVREALVNAVCHRDYRTRGRRIELRKFSDRMEIISPGGLAGYITLDNIVEEHFSRNPRIVQGLFQWGYIEELGLGIDRMIEDMAAHGHPIPKFNATAHGFTVVLSNHRERRGHFGASTPVVTPEGLTVNERQARALQYIREHGRITNRDYQNICPDVTAETLRTDLVDMVEKGVLMRIGEKKGTYYILK